MGKWNTLKLTNQKWFCRTICPFVHPDASFYVTSCHGPVFDTIFVQRLMFATALTVEIWDSTFPIGLGIMGILYAVLVTICMVLKITAR